jgi:hypothetical protein
MKIIIYALLLFISLNSNLFAYELDYRGFVSYTFTDVPKYDTGLGISYKNDLFDMQGLFMLSKDGEYDNTGVKYLYIERQQAINQDSSIGLRIGRIRHWLGFHNLKRENPRASDYIWHPPAIYREQASHFTTSGDGLQLYLKTDIFDWNTCLNLTHAKPILEPMSETAAVIFNNKNIGYFTDKSRITGVNLAISSPQKILEFRYDLSILDFDFIPNYRFLNPGNTNTQVHTFGTRYYILDDLDITLERIMVRNYGSAWDKFHVIWPADGHAGGYGVSLRYRFNSDLQLSLSHDKWCTDETDCDGTRGDKFNVPRHKFFSNTNTIA